MITCCKEKKCLEVSFLCVNPGAPGRLFRVEKVESVAGGDGDEGTTNGFEHSEKNRVQG